MEVILNTDHNQMKNRELGALTSTSIGIHHRLKVKVLEITPNIQVIRVMEARVKVQTKILTNQDGEMEEVTLNLERVQKINHKKRTVYQTILTNKSLIMVRKKTTKTLTGKPPLTVGSTPVGKPLKMVGIILVGRVPTVEAQVDQFPLINHKNLKIIMITNLNKNM